MLERLHGKEVPGTGIGLSVTRRIAELHGETVRIGDNPGGRTTVTFTLQTPHKMGDEHNITKPLVPTEFLATIRSIEDYRITTVRLPTRPV